MKHSRLRLLLLLVLTLLSAPGAWSQGTTTSAMTGIITDKAGAGLPGATVIAVHTPTNTQYVAPTNSEGRFNIPNMRVGGPYTVRVTFIGYKDTNREGIFLTLGQNQRLDINLSEATTELAGVTVSGKQDPTLNSQRSGAATNVQREQIERLPTLSRSFQDFTRLTPQANGNSLGGRNGRFNNIQIDGASNNDLFGLGNSGAPGGQAGTNPISLDAIQEFQVVLSPYDVRQGRFSGGAINAVTRSGTNDFSGSVFAFGRNENTAGKSVTPDASGNRTKLAEFYDYQTGFRLGGPIIKDKLFFFVNGEITRRSAPVLFRAGAPGETGTDVVGFVNSDQLQQIQNKLAEYGYDAGGFGDVNAETRSNKAFARLDWNISQNHQLTLRHNFVDALDDNISRGTTNFRFGNNAYQFLSKTNSTVMELKSRFGSRYANNLLVGYSRIRDSRQTKGALFPSITISVGNGTVSAGSEVSSTQNRLSQDVLEITDNFNVFAGKHVLTVGTNNEIFRFDNLFVQRTEGSYDWPSLNAFLTNDVAATNFRYRQNFALPGGKPTAKFGAAQFGAYVQDEYNVTDNFRVTTGVRFDLPVYFDKPSYNYKVDSTFATANAQTDAYDVRTNRLPKSRLQVSPRIGFNWDVRKDQTFQLRGGVGMFTGRPAYVWISNQYGGTGVDFSNYDSQTAGNNVPSSGFGLSSNYNNLVGQVRNLNSRAAKGSVAVTAKDFKNPQLIRTNFAVDYRLPLGIVGTLEGIYSKTLNDVLPQDINLVNPTGVLLGDGRPVYPTGTNNATQGANRYRNSKDFNSVFLLTNTSKGYQYSLTAELKKQVTTDLFASAAYTYGQSRDVYSGSSSTAQSIWEFNPHVAGPNNLPLSYSNFDLRHRVIGSFSYRKAYAEHFATTISAFYNGQSGAPFSYSYYGTDLNGDGGTATGNSNDLIYIPRNQSEIVLITDGPNDRRSVDQIWSELNSFIENDDYLREHRGEYAARNGARTPWQHRIDVRLLQDFYTTIGSKQHTIQLSVDVLNFGNLLNKDWGRDYFVSNQNYGLLRYQGLEGGSTGRPQFSYGTGTSATPKEAYQVSQITSRWQAQFGVRYLF
ncbi:carboxypeptidase regulatory-like domain-containing protein [Hymenobacter sp. BT635]|uniref:Carboxypeptidase regulatory-like domain-containing protein n=1 Tax=Hymenobacter nitidus TaxID=2880929 RepID=A0ABS8AH06_9BACT|nr:carboxypeptidase regulatory-like domain-containing protein [Hymenobacter nitidus]MCB2379706.1 carboxypeptidase regulatory-like domain-containing protein [Hymenobacter nitidus]